jgi:hypothetical protein
MQAQRGTRGIAPDHLQPGTRRWWEVSTMLQLLHPWEKPGALCIGGWVGFEAILLQVTVMTALSWLPVWKPKGMK